MMMHNLVISWKSLKARSNFESTFSALLVSDLMLSTYSSMIIGTVPQFSFEDKYFSIVLTHMGLLFQTYLFTYISSIFNSKDKHPAIVAHTLSKPLFGSPFSVLLDVLKVEF